MSHKWHITVVHPDNYPFFRTFDEIAEALVYSLQRLGCIVSFSENSLVSDATNIVLGAHLLQEPQQGALERARIVVYNFEQLPQQLGSWAHYERVLKRFPVWDYSALNVEWLRSAGNTSARHVPLGYVPVWSRVPRGAHEDIDVLFFGSLSERRRVLVQKLMDAGLGVSAVFNVYGLARDALIGRSRVVVNVHQFGPDDRLEEVRLLYLWANRKAVVSEMADVTQVPAVWRNAAVWSPYDRIVEACRELVADAKKRDALASAAFEAVSQFPYWDVLRDRVLMGAEAAAGAADLAW